MATTIAASTGDSAVLPLPPRAPPGNAVRDMTSMVPEALVERIRRGPDAERQLRAEEDERRFLTGQKIREEQRITERLAQEAVGLEDKLGKRSEEARATRRAQTVAEPEFKPSKMELDDYRNLAGMLVGLGMLAGTSGKSGAMYALNSLNGMMKGFAEGRRDLFKNEQVQFEKQLKSIEATNKRVQRDFEDAMSLLQTDRQLGLAKMQRLKAELGNSVAGIALQLNDLDAVRSNLQRQVTSSEKATADAAKLIEMQETREARAATEKDRLEEARLRREETERSNRAMERIAAIRAAGGGGGGRVGQNNLMFAGRVYSNILGAANDLAGIASLPATSQSPLLSGVINQDPTTVLGSLTAAAARKMTSKDQRAFDQVANSLDLALVKIEGQGLASSATKYNVAAYSALRPRSGDSAINMAIYLAKVRQEIETGVLSHSRMAGATAEQKQDLQNVLRNVQKTIPFTLDNVTTVLRKGTVRLDEKTQRILGLPTVTEEAIRAGAANLNADMPEVPRSQSSSNSRPATTSQVALPKVFATEADAQTAFNEGTLKRGEKINIGGDIIDGEIKGGTTGTWE